MRRLAVLVIAATAFTAVPAQGAEAVTVGVSVRDDLFSPRTLTVRRGTVLRFVWRRTRNPHNVCASGRCSRTTRRSGFVYRRTARRSTTLICTVHPTQMRLRLRVR